MILTTAEPFTHLTKDSPALWDIDKHIKDYSKMGRSKFYNQLVIHPDDLRLSTYPLDTLSIFLHGSVCKISHADAHKGWLIFHAEIPKSHFEPADTLNDA